MSTRHGTSNPGQPGNQHTSPRLHSAYRNKQHPTPEEARASRAKWIEGLKRAQRVN